LVPADARSDDLLDGQLPENLKNGLLEDVAVVVPRRCQLDERLEAFGHVSAKIRPFRIRAQTRKDDLAQRVEIRRSGVEFETRHVADHIQSGSSISRQPPGAEAHSQAHARGVNSLSHARRYRCS